MNNPEYRRLLARDKLLSNDSYLLKVTLDDYARFFASTFYNTPTMMVRPDPAQLLSKYLSQLEQLRSELPPRFWDVTRGVEVMLGVPVTARSAWRYHHNHGELRDYFWTQFYYHLGGASDEQKRRIQTASMAAQLRRRARTCVFLVSLFWNETWPRCRVSLNPWSLIRH
ncbi:hypothetical protein B0T17DRAFT_397766 [Bombardia bombarda]|uniref:Uncharacterized protein n=1 Tax=Bombardia bombarda TaxID=252184 RepID=A0AA39U805_9PEZI|nr:hypothetical protein B0T17DRAFT_397766 [Bombardia bombarda]